MLKNAIEAEISFSRPGVDGIKEKLPALEKHESLHEKCDESGAIVETASTIQSRPAIVESGSENLIAQMSDPSVLKLSVLNLPSFVSNDPKDHALWSRGPIFRSTLFSVNWRHRRPASNFLDSTCPLVARSKRVFSEVGTASKETSVSVVSVEARSL